MCYIYITCFSHTNYHRVPCFLCFLGDVLHLMILSCFSNSSEVFRLAMPSKKVSAFRSTTSPLGAMP